VPFRRGCGAVGLLVGTHGTHPRCQNQGRAYHNVDHWCLYGGDGGQTGTCTRQLGRQGQVWRSQLQLLEQSEGSDSSFYPTGTTSTVILA
jgi:hypothetical protein